MKVCPQCSTQYDDSMFFCLEDGTPLRYPTDINLEQTLAIPRKNEAETVELNSSENTLPIDLAIEPKSVETEAWQNITNLPKVNTDEGIEGLPITTNINTAESAGKGKFIALFGLLGALVLTISGYIGWWLSQPLGTDVAVTNVNKQIPNAANLNNNSASSNDNVTGEGNKANSNVFDDNVSTNSNVLPNSNVNKTTPKPSPTKDKSPTPTPKETPVETPTPTPIPTPKTPTPIPSPTRTTPPDVVNSGVVNGKAIFLYQPKYPIAAKSNGIGGRVNVQVLIDENGSVIRARAVNGHPLLRAPSEEAARSSKFSPTMIDGQRVKVTGVIVFNFNPN